MFACEKKSTLCPDDHGQTYVIKKPFSLSPMFLKNSIHPFNRTRKGPSKSIRCRCGNTLPHLAIVSVSMRPHISRRNDRRLGQRAASVMKASGVKSESAHQLYSFSATRVAHLCSHTWPIPPCPRNRKASPFPESYGSVQQDPPSERIADSQASSFGYDSANLVHIHATDTAQRFHIFNILAYHLQQERDSVSWASMSLTEFSP